MKDYCIFFLLVFSFFSCLGQKDTTQYFSYSMYVTPKLVSQSHGRFNDRDIDILSGFSIGANAHYNLYGSAIKVGLSTSKLNFGYKEVQDNYTTQYYRSEYSMKNICLDILANLKIGNEFKSHGYLELGFSSFINSKVEGRYYALKYMQKEETLLEHIKIGNEQEIKAFVLIGFGYKYQIKPKNFIKLGIVGEVSSSELNLDWENPSEATSRIFSLGLQLAYEFQ